MRRNLIFLVSIAVIVMIGGGVYFFFFEPLTTTKKVAILNLGSYPLMDTIKEQSREHIISELKENVEVDVFDANFQSEVLRSSAETIVQSGYDVAISITTPATQALLGRNEGRIPVIFTFVSAPSAIGYSGPQSLDNATGFFDTVPIAENLDFIRAILGSDAVIGYVVNDAEASASEAFSKFESAVSQYDLQLLKIPVSSQADIRTAVTVRSNDVDAFLIGPDSVVTGAIESVTTISNDRNVPLFCTDPVSVERGCLAAIAPDYGELGVRTAKYALRILRGEATVDLPTEDFHTYRAYWNEHVGTELQIEIPESALNQTEISIVGNK